VPVHRFILVQCLAAMFHPRMGFKPPILFPDAYA
jgi:hypothetical protein